MAQTNTAQTNTAETDTPPAGAAGAASPTRALRPAPNAAARMQEVLRRGAGTSPTLPEDAAADTATDATALPAANTTTSEVAQTTLLPEGSATSSQTENLIRAAPSPPRQKRKAAPGSVVAPATRIQAASTTGSVVGSATGSDPVRQAMLGMLAQPYPPDMGEGAMTVTSVKIPKPVWERLEYARTVTKKDKQDIIAEALRLYFDRIVEDNQR